jgi:ABC-type antimicrobial peptide transport system permease subunit
LTLVNSDQQAYNNITELETWITDETEWQQGRLVSWIFGAFAGLALVLAAVGLFSVVSYTVAQRTNEFGIRMALGAQRGHVLRIVFASTFVSVGCGILIGLAFTFALNRIIAKWVAGNPNNPIILLEGTILLVLVSAIACALPALRAARLNPMTALRCE